ncbi:hypothetical protein F5G77_17615 [Salmonella enterica]|nr:hypothetical protein [Salmonella enterica]
MRVGGISIASRYNYCERKAEQHKGMRQIGILQTDPPRWPQEIETPFEKHIFGVFLHLNKFF